MDFPVTNRIFCWIFEITIGGEVYQTVNNEFVVRCNGDLYNENGVVYNPPEIVHWTSFEGLSKQLWEELSALDLKGLSNGEAFDEIALYAEDLYDEQEEYKANEVTDSITKKHDLWSPKMLGDNYFSLTSTTENQAYFLYLYSEHEISSVDVFLANAQRYAEIGLVQNIFASGKVLWENKVKYVYVIYEKAQKVVGFEELKTAKLRPATKKKVEDSIQKLQQKLEEHDLVIPSPEKNLFYFDRGTLSLYVKSPISVYKTSWIQLSKKNLDSLLE